MSAAVAIPISASGMSSALSLRVSAASRRLVLAQHGTPVSTYTTQKTFRFP